MPAKKIKEARMNVCDFQTLKVIGRGAFGEVQLVGRHSDAIASDLFTVSFPYAHTTAISLD